jgi:MFS-type transporter involved in bile tolerance (Atg22 family)
VEQGATATVLCFGLGNFFGLLVGGGGGRFLYKLDPRFPALLAGSSAILGCIPFWLLLTTIDSTSPVLYIGVVTVLAGLGSGVTGPIVKATLTNVTLPTTRGQAFAIFNLFDDFGRGLGPVFVSLLIFQMGGRTPAFNVGVLGWVVCGILNSLTYLTVARDERKVQATLAASLRHGSCANSDRATNSSEFV